MNIYFLVEGKQTERRVYPKWLSHLVPQLTGVNSFDRVIRNHYYLFSGNGYPSLLNHLENAVADVNQHGKFDYLVLCLDVDDSTPNDREQLICKRLETKLNSTTQFVVICQNKCFETWFLGNRRIFKRNPSNPQLSKYIEHYNVRENDPEQMAKPDGFNRTTSIFHSHYFQLICRERGNCRYSKEHPGLVAEKPFLDELIARYNDTTPHHHIASFGRFFLFCEEVKRQMGAVT
jgi:hypothetical protein